MHLAGRPSRDFWILVFKLMPGHETFRWGTHGGGAGDFCFWTATTLGVGGPLPRLLVGRYWMYKFRFSFCVLLWGSKGSGWDVIDWCRTHRCCFLFFTRLPIQGFLNEALKPFPSMHVDCVGFMICFRKGDGYDERCTQTSKKSI